MPDVAELDRHLAGMRRAVDEADSLTYPGADPEQRERLRELARRMRYHASRFYLEMGANHETNGGRFGE